MRYFIKIIFTSLILISCKNNEKLISQEFYYPNKPKFSKNKNHQFIDIKTFENFNQLVDNLEILNYHGKKAYLKIESKNIII
ncbi:hypothetical protein CXF68_00980 [Tenacibaculum sp. Bg11-29]|uniref:hypothetical protein n=1 Tax=Tenacibaculum sp. Bg11-29 TaxID=2058306 RepID=UPI000C31E934|nr:hypothetical protein [Tenacibaculum sp. Bg11-29]PKH49346.1 hypothetical protein CXF68_00980 [Tenacibaculum sp. Bg11-29]